MNFAGETTTLDLTRPCANAVDDDGDGLGAELSLVLAALGLAARLRQ